MSLVKLKEIDDQIYQLNQQSKVIIKDLMDKIGPSVSVSFVSEQAYDDDNYYQSFSLKTIEGIDLYDFPAKDIFSTFVGKLKNALTKESENILNKTREEIKEQLTYGEDLIDLVELVAREKCDIEALYEMITIGHYGLNENQVPQDLISYE